MNFSLQILNRVPSTNTCVKEAIDALAPEGTAYLAFMQEKGYGRQGRTWVSPYGGLYTSLLLQPPISAVNLGPLTLVVGLCTRNALVSVAKEIFGIDLDHEIRIKWPNDIVWETGKLGGISSEIYHGSVCIGIGVNVFRPYCANQVSGKNKPVYFAEVVGEHCSGIDTSRITASYKELLAPESDATAADDLRPAQRRYIESCARAILSEIEKTYPVFCREGFSAFQAQYLNHMAFQGRQAQIELIDGTALCQGSITGVDKDGCLLIQDEAGTVRTLNSGEVHILSL
ncbi:MAG: biotin--[acetyl-CoA-carboxylase] ligase [Eggerthellaceae bacterium]|jgi:BirA family biotin operon repressor/biotin-[acetyl-CoA-carboxylase] ligase